MLAALVVGQAVAMPKLVEFPTSKGDLVAIEALIKLPKLEPGHRYRLMQAAYNAVKMTPSYSRRDISRVMAPGYRFRVDQLADALRLGLTVEPKDLAAGLSVLSSVLTEPSFLPDAIKVDPSKGVAGWARATQSFQMVPTDIDQAYFQDIWKIVVQPGAITVGVRGPFAEGAASAAWAKRETYWREYTPNKSVYGRSTKTKLETGEPPILVFRTSLNKLTPSDVFAATVMGGGKDSLLWKICREELRMSYRQEAFVVPTENGWEFRMAVATDSSNSGPEKVSELRERLSKGIDSLVDSDLVHAQGLLRGYFQYQQFGFPMLLGACQVTGGDVNETLFRDMYLTAKGVPALNDVQWLDSPSLGDCKKKLHDLLDAASVELK